ncbi:hypothetical protein TRSC58_07329 [Trypanosoma rangeli SC58]|uniref:Uncharacterized protein n=1 Tax=Trypanosoma rangeli SC58 TaxID=429131 RepID=A0A061IS40_TRYRA|nr:hypothetical protein TRSC58_07329 [Trypanosoma rangeli SC58]
MVVFCSALLLVSGNALGPPQTVHASKASLILVVFVVVSVLWFGCLVWVSSRLGLLPARIKPLRSLRYHRHKTRSKKPAAATTTTATKRTMRLCLSVVPRTCLKRVKYRPNVKGSPPNQKKKKGIKVFLHSQ